MMRVLSIRQAVQRIGCRAEACAQHEPGDANVLQVDEARAADGQDWDVASVLTVVQKAARSWNPDRLQRFPDLRWASTDRLPGHCLKTKPCTGVPCVLHVALSV